MKYFIASRWRNKEKVEELTAKLRAKGETVYNFIEIEGQYMGGEDVEEEMREFEAIKDWRTNPKIKELFDRDVAHLKEADAFILLLPAGNSSHIEAGIAYGLGKKMIVIGEVEKAETHYLIFNEFYKTIDEFIDSL